MHSTNGSIPTVQSPDITERGGALLDELDTLIAEMDTAIREANVARRQLARTEAEMELIEAHQVLATTGSNAETRKATITVRLAEDSTYQRLTEEAASQQDRLRDAERRLVISKERTRLVRAALALLTNGD